ncbi:MAG: beta-Ala-His dipeptidase, partial [Bacteroidia bacterium]|nr:beta-Ala-His dipeptidase [Bacteroidia bacterium]
MSYPLSQLEPASLWHYFSELNAVPRPSKKEERVIQFMLDFGKSLNLESFKDEVGNVIIKKPATADLENRATVVMQSHLDMVHQKNADTVFDFDKQGIDMFVEGDWVKAKGTTLGADNGIGVATIMAILASKDIPHPAIEALFTIDEETGMTGALGLKGGLLSGKILLNLDTEDDHELTIGCAGGVDVSANVSYAEVGLPSHHKSLFIKISGLTGGHSGMDIILGRANANKLMNRLLLNLTHSHEIHISMIDGGGLRNAIPRESISVISVEADNLDKIKQAIQSTADIFKQEYRITDPNLSVSITDVDSPNKAIEPAFQRLMLHVINVLPNGIHRMTPGIEGLVQTSNNVARVLVKDGSLSIQCLTRSSVDSEKMDLAAILTSGFELLGAKTDLKGSYPG